MYDTKIKIKIAERMQERRLPKSHLFLEYEFRPLVYLGVDGKIILTSESLNWLHVTQLFCITRDLQIRMNYDIDDEGKAEGDDINDQHDYYCYCYEH
jgi:hypothetical protein